MTWVYNRTIRMADHDHLFNAETGIGSNLRGEPDKGCSTCLYNGWKCVPVANNLKSMVDDIVQAAAAYHPHGAGIFTVDGDCQARPRIAVYVDCGQVGILTCLAKTVSEPELRKIINNLDLNDTRSARVIILTTYRTWHSRMKIPTGTSGEIKVIYFETLVKPTGITLVKEQPQHIWSSQEPEDDFEPVVLAPAVQLDTATSPHMATAKDDYSIIPE
ncbi:hypothetical protein FQN49_001816 [Arthroderma sp. PD_2]|nr:hypothetical protein FQN49_001816 [Arthroderma sp. PD_2]